MLEDNPMLSINIIVLKLWGFLINRRWCTVPIYFLVCANGVTQIGELYETLDDAEKAIKSAYLSILWVNGCIRGGVFLCYGKAFEDFMQGIDDVYMDIRKYCDVTANLILDTHTRRARFISNANLILGAFSSLCFVVYPLFSSTKENRIHAYGTWFPFEFDSKDKSPYYEIIYTIQILLTIPGCCMYIPFSNLLATYLIFGIARLQVLQHYLVNTKYGDEVNDKFIKRRLRDCVKCHQQINRYVTEINDLVTNLMFLEFLFFTVMLCALLFLLIIISKLSQILIVCSYIFMILAQLFIFYWHANELTLESLAVANAAYTGPWYEYNASAKKTLQILMARAQRPLLVSVGNIYPMGLEMFQTILNSAYSYFTVLRGVYD